MVRRWLPARGPRRFVHQAQGDLFRLGRGDLPMRPRFALIANLDPPILPFAHRYLGLPWRIVAGPLQLKIAVLVTHHPVIGDAALGFQTKHLLQLPARWAPCGDNPAARRARARSVRCDRAGSAAAEIRWPPGACGSSYAPSS